MQNFCLSEAILERFKSAENELGYCEHIVTLDCNTIDSWAFRDRKSFEIGSIDSLAKSIQQAGQCQPIILVRVSESFRPKDNPEAQYVIIAGYRRWMACKTHKLDVQAVVRTLNFEQAISVLMSEYEKEDVSDYSKGILYHTLLTTEKISKEQLCQRLHLKLAQLEQYLTFAQVPEHIWIAIGDISRVSAKTAGVMQRIIEQGPLYQDALISIAHKIAQGYGAKRVQQAVDTIVDKQLQRQPKGKIIEHKIKIQFNGKTIMNLHQGRIKLDSSLVNHGNFDELVSKLEKNVTDFAKNYFGQRNS